MKMVCNPQTHGGLEEAGTVSSLGIIESQGIHETGKGKNLRG